MSYSRRDFMETAARAAAGAGLASALPLQAFGRRPAPSDTLQVALIGCGGMGYFDLENHIKQPGVVCRAMCDVDEQRLNERAAQVEKLQGQKPALYKDFRKLLEDKEIDAVVIGTPDHWHCLQTVMACEAGKDVYVEKPMANSIAECQVMVAAARKYQRIVQVGQQQRSGAHWQEVVDFVRSGKLGKIRHIKLWGFFDYGKGMPKQPDAPVPPQLDYEMWLGPAPMRPYNKARHHGVWRHNWDYGGGLLSDWGVHLLDIPLWAMDVKGAPFSASASGGIFAYAQNEIQTPDTLSVLYDMGQYTLSWEHAGGLSKGYYDRNYGIAFIAANGTLIANRSGWKVVAEELDGKPLMEAVPFKGGRESNHEAHAINFIEAVKARKDPACTVEMGAQAAFYAHMGNIAYRRDSRLAWDEAKGSFGKNKLANDLIRPEYRAPWAFPKL
jgi:predicted dehydrogenase